MNKIDVRLAKKQILKCLTEDFSYTSETTRRKVHNNALFDAKEGYMIYNQMDLEMVMDAVVRGLYMALKDSHDSISSSTPVQETA